MVLPIFIFAVSIFLYGFQLILIQQQIQTALVRTVQFYAKNAYLMEELDSSIGVQDLELSELSRQLGIEALLSDEMYRHMFFQYLRKSKAADTLIQGGSDQIVIRGNSYDSDDVGIWAYYTCNIPVIFFKLNSFEIMQYCTQRKWTGISGVKRYGEVSEEPNENEEYVYITKTGKRYHTHEDCSYIRINIYTATLGQVKGLRNKSNGRYHPCELCVQNMHIEENGIVLYTEYGDRYHSSANCSGIKRSAERIRKSDVPDGMTVCIKCKNWDELERR